MHSIRKSSLIVVIFGMLAMIQTTCTEPGSVVCSTGIVCPENRKCAKNQAVCLEINSSCGDGIVDEGEECDDGTIRNGPDCSSECKIPRCGDGDVYGQKWDPEKETYVLAEMCDHGCETQSEWESKNHDCIHNEINEKINCSLDCSTNYLCGNGIKDPGEVCDPNDEDHEGWGLAGGEDYCSEDCRSSGVCGNGYVDGNLGEECEESVAFPEYVPDGTKCLDCRLVYCGNGEVEKDEGEDCEPKRSMVTDDDGKQRLYLENTVDCTIECTETKCGDGIINERTGEECEVKEAEDFNDFGWKGVDINGDDAFCNANCKINTGNDGFVNVAAGEECEPDGTGFGGGYNEKKETVSCNGDNKINRCGDGKVNTRAREECDVSNIDLGNTLEPFVLEDETFYCTPKCKLNVCGDGYLQSENGEEACDSEGINTQECVGATCRLSVCGDGIINENGSITPRGSIGDLVLEKEVCDDGINPETNENNNMLMEDILSFSDYVTKENLGSRDPTIQENSYYVYLNDFNLELNKNCYHCSERPTCGNNIVEIGEVCDDGNVVGGDGCSENCRSTELCGNGILDTAAGETCDFLGINAGNAVVSIQNGESTIHCTPKCTLNVCGDGYLGEDEKCDSEGKNTKECVGKTCTISICGDGEINENGSITSLSSTEKLELEKEICDDGEDKNILMNEILSFNEYVNENCPVSDEIQDLGCFVYLGEGAGEEAKEIEDKARASQERAYVNYLDDLSDRGNIDVRNKCYRCRERPVCGNGEIEIGEVCDDGNVVGGDGCAANCRSTELCGNGTLDVSAGEACDTPGELGCALDCMTGMSCGNGIVEQGELCDTGDRYPNNDGPCVITVDLKTCSENSWRYLHVYEFDSQDNCAEESRVDDEQCGDNSKEEGEVCCKKLLTECSDSNTYSVCLGKEYLDEEDICSPAGKFEDKDGAVAFKSGECSPDYFKRDICIAKSCQLAQCGDGFVYNRDGGTEACDLGDKNGSDEIVDGYICTETCRKRQDVFLSTQAVPSGTGVFTCKVLTEEDVSCGDDSGYGTCEESYSLGTKVCVMAVPNENEKYEFLGDNNNSGCPGEGWLTTGVCLVDMGTADKSVYANFTKQPMLTTSTSPAEGAGSLVNCENSTATLGTNSISYATGSVVEVCAKPAETHSMNTKLGCPGVEWSETEVDSGVYKCTVTMNGEQNIQAIFETIAIAGVRVTNDGEGNLKCKKGRNTNLNYSCQESDKNSAGECSFEYDLEYRDKGQNKGYDHLCVFAADNETKIFRKNESVCPSGSWSADNICTVKYGTTGEVKATFNDMPRFTYSVSCNPAAETCSEAGVISATASGANVLAGNSVQKDATVVVTVNPPANYELLTANNTNTCPNNGSWNNNVCTFTMETNDVSMMPLLTRKPKVTATKSATGGQWVSCESPHGNIQVDETTYYQTSANVAVCVEIDNDYNMSNFDTGCNSGAWTLLTEDIYKCAIDNIDGDKLIYANITANPTTNVQVSNSGEGVLLCSEKDVNGNNSYTCDAIDATATCSPTYQLGSEYHRQWIGGYTTYKYLCMKATNSETRVFNPFESTCPGGSWTENSPGVYVCTVAYNAVGIAKAVFNDVPRLTYAATCGDSGASCGSLTGTVTSGTQVPANTSLTLTATPPENYELLGVYNTSCPAVGGWVPNGSGGHTCSWSMETTATDVKVLFTQKPQLTVNLSAGGQIVECSAGAGAIASGSYHVTGSGVDVCVKANNAYEFASTNQCNGGAWTPLANDVYMCTITMSGNQTVSPSFTPAAATTVTLAKIGAGSMTCQSVDDDSNETNECASAEGFATCNGSYSLLSGKILCVEATPSAETELNTELTNCAGEPSNLSDGICAVPHSGAGAESVVMVFTTKPQLTVNMIPSAGGSIVPCVNEGTAVVSGAYYSSGDDIEVCVRANDNYAFDENSTCPEGSSWTALQDDSSIYQCTVTMNGNQSLIPSFIPTATMTLTVSDGVNYSGYAVAEGACEFAGNDSFITIASPAIYPVGQELCIKAPAYDETNKTMLDATKGCQWSELNGDYYYCDVTVGASGTAVTMRATAWPILTKGDGVASVKEGSCDTETSINFTNNTASVKPTTELCATVTEIANLDTASGCPGGYWSIDADIATCSFAMPATAETVAAVMSEPSSPDGGTPEEDAGESDGGSTSGEADATTDEPDAGAEDAGANKDAGDSDGGSTPDETDAATGEPDAGAEDAGGNPDP